MKRLLFLLIFAVGAISAIAQEICNNGIDDDGDGFIDCYDASCSASTFCKDFFLGEPATCEVTPPAFPQFTMALDFASPDQTTNHLARMAIGDLDRDGIPEIVTMNRYTKRLFILNGQDGSIQEQKTVDFTPNWEVAIANVDDDDCAEIFFLGTDRRIYAYDCNLNYLWRTSQMPGDPINYGLADFDGDGKVELYAKDMIFDAHTGTRIVNTSASSWSRINGGPVAVDMLGDEDLELVLGCKIYEVDLGNRTQDAGKLTLLKSRSEYYIRNEYNATSVADYNQDGYLDVLASGSTNKHGDNTTIFFWDVHNDVLKTYSDPKPGDFTIYACPTKTGEYYEDGWINGTGRINIADLDGDGNLNVSYVSGKYLYALDHNLNPLPWSPKVVNEETSGHTGCTLFDFNGDGSSEIVYRDERFLYIINGTDGSIYNQQTCISRTNREYPIVADVDADGSTEMCVTCGFDDQESIDEFCDLSYARYSHVRVFRSGSDPWVPARRVWNQHGYFNVNVNDDLTIPTRQQKHHLVFSEGSCTQGPNRPLNGFLNQSPFLNIDGCPTYKSPDLAYVDNSLTVTPPTCPDKDFTVSFQIQNIGDIALSGDVSISFYDADPMQPGANRLGTIKRSVNLSVDEVYAVNSTVNGTGGPFTLYIVLNDDGTSLPTPISLPNTFFLECDYANNIISASIVSLPADLEALKVADNLKCVGSTTPDNGAAKAFVSINGSENVTAFNFYWSQGTSAKAAPADYQGANINGLTEGQYTVYAVHKTLGCSSDTAGITINRVTPTISLDIAVVEPFTNCKHPDGHLRVIVNDTDGDGVGDNPNNYTYVWYEGNDIFTDPQVSIDDDPDDLKPLTYTVVVTDKATGCQSIESATVPNESEVPVASVTTTDITCALGDIGSASANVNGKTASYVFRWYDGVKVKPTPDHTGAAYSNLAAGDYTVVVTSNASKCESEPVTVTIHQSDPVSVSVTGVGDQTSCDPALPNGTASANVGGATTGYTFEWYVGQAAVGTPIATTANVTGLDAGVYTVKATDNSTGCFDTEEVTIDFAVQTPSLIPGAIGDLTNCTTPNGSITVDVSLDTPAEYTFYWYEGASVKTSPDFSDNDNVLDGLSVGTYTVVAVHNTKHCTTQPVTAEVVDNTPTIDIIQNAAALKVPSDCNTGNGEMQVDVSAAGNVAGFLIEWFRDGETTPFASANGVSTSLQQNLSAGLYTIRATNLDNGCSMENSFELPFADAHELTFVSKLNATTCDPQNEGEIVVELAPTPTAGFTVNDYILEFYHGQGTQGTPAQTVDGSAGTPNGDGTSNFTFSALTPGYYTLVAVENHPALNNCPSVPVIIEIKGGATAPYIVVSMFEPNSNCDGALANGMIQLDIDGVAPESDYTYAWFEGGDNSSPALGTNTTGTVAGDGILQNLPAGLYTVEVTNSATLCMTSRTISLINDPPTIAVPAGGIEVTHVTMCSDMSGGIASVVNLLEDGAAANMADYTFEWFDADQNRLPGTASTINGLAAGDYYVQIVKTSGTTGLECSSALIAFAVEDQTVGTVTVSLADFTLPTRCLQPANMLGELVASAGGTSTTGYTYSWYAGSTASGTPVDYDDTHSGITVPSGQTEVTFTVRVVNNSNDCSVDKTFTLPLDIIPVELTSSASPVTSCMTDNGSIFATVISANGNAYTYNWFEGTTVDATADYTGKQHDGMAIGSYTVVAVDPTDTFCQSEPDTVVVEDGRVFPVVTALELAPLTICDPSRPDGVATASVNGNVVNYHFNWYNGTPPVGASVYNGATYGNLPAGTFSVIASHLVSGCSDTTAVTIEERFIKIPVPTVDVLTHDTSCEDDNGALSASIHGNTSDFIFHWYNSNPGPAPDTTLAANIGEIYSPLSPATYYVSATSRATGCISAPGSGEILDQPLYPEFVFLVTNPSCSVFGINPDGGYDSNGEPNGSVTLNLLNSVELRSITWYAGAAQIATGPILSNIEAGYYSVEVITTSGCVERQEVTVLPDVNAFNGISRNGDDQNPIFHINCIENYPNNSVKIYNRAGTLVYEAHGYNNTDIFFDGRSNKGVSLMGTDLPDGTYYYIVNKNDGSAVVSGYLEIVK